MSILLFHYGGNCPSKIAQLLGITKEEVFDRSVPAILKNHQRVFLGKDKDYDNTSVATLIPKEGTNVLSYATLVEEEELKLIDKWEGEEYK